MVSCEFPFVQQYTVLSFCVGTRAAPLTCSVVLSLMLILGVFFSWGASDVISAMIVG
jgi:hypothetical protein